ncbi:Wzz/FepE/Etk N-terminal domain-containing protein [Kitasatospora sp. NPDC005751]|uniref:Wzz/FepE/Etk N-terminal domain-containing protein n=1 Tax=Kitasatospora sp. NPDC005751 TaxID=3157064 RepID=UPI0033F8E36E
MSEPRRSVRSLARRWWPVVLAVPLGAAAGAGYAVVAHPSYAANSYVIVVPENQGESASAINFAQAYGRLAGQPQVLAAAAAETGHSRTELETLVHGTTSPDAPMIEITGTGARPREAVLAADAVARSLVAFANTSSKETGVRLVPLAPAAEPDKPTTPSAQLDVAVGAAAGVLIGALVMMTRRRGGEAGPAAVATPGTEPAAPATPRPRAEEAPTAEAPAPAEPAAAERPGTGQAVPEQAAPAQPTSGKAAGGKSPAEKAPAKEKSAAGSGR